jgi:serine/threonine protein kinase/Tfp pilus assembly protein PilF
MGDTLFSQREVRNAVPKSDSITSVYRFGPFEVNTASGELLKQGVRVKLQEQPFRLLIVLLESAGEPVTHEDLHRRIWENNTFVEFDSSLRVAVRKLRDALGDDADNPHYIETIPRKGYRFLGPVVRVESADSQKILIGQIISHYRLIGKVGSGGMGAVYEAEDMRLGRRVALKFLPENLARDQRALQRFEREARAASSLNHPNICTLYEVEEHDSQPVIVMELLQGESLQDRLRKGPLSGDELVDIGIQTSEGLEAAHTKGIIHRDIKPGNIFIVGAGRVKILDFGLAKVVAGDVPEDESEEDSLTEEGTIPGTTSYMSPEQVRGEEVDARSDLFSLGVVLYETATGHRPFVGKNRVLLMNAILNENPKTPSRVNPKLPAALDTIIAKVLEKERSRRYEHAADLCSDLKQLKRETEPGQKAVASAPPAARVQPRRVPIAAGLVALMILVVIGIFFLYSRRLPALTERDTIVLADFDNKTGDSVFDGTLRQGMAVQLEQSPFLSLISDERIRQTLRLMGRPADSQLTPELAREICERTGSRAVLEGSIANLGSQYVLGLRTKNCDTGDTLDDEQAQSTRKEDVLNALSQIASKFRSRIGESLSSVEKHSTPLAEATTTSLEALKAYSTGMRVAFSTGFVPAVPHLERAVEIDPKFAMAHAQMGLIYSDIGESALSAESTSKAYQLREFTSDREKFFITANYARQVTGNLGKAQQILELWAQTYPRDSVPHGLMSGFICQGSGHYEESVEEAKKAIGLDPDSTPGYVNLAYSYSYLDRLTDAQNTLQRASERKIEIPELLLLRYQIAFLKDDETGMDRETALAKGKPGAEDWISHSEALVLARSGQLRLAGRMSRRAIDLAQQAGQRERAATYETGVAVWEAFFGNALAARQSVMAALNLSKGRDVEYGAAFALALSGDSSRSQMLANDLERRFPEDTSVRFNYMPTLRALLALKNNDPRKAIELLQIAVPYELAVPGIDFIAFFGSLYPTYVRGEAYLASHQGAEAAMEFQKLLDHRGLVFSDPVGAVARLQLGRAYAQAGDLTKARAAYQDFLVLWKDADPGIPILNQAKAEYANLQ